METYAVLYEPRSQRMPPHGFAQLHAPSLGQQPTRPRLYFHFFEEAKATPIHDIMPVRDMVASSTTNWDDILMKECERIMATPTHLPNETLRIMKLGDDMEIVADGESTSSLSEDESSAANRRSIHRPMVRKQKQNPAPRHRSQSQPRRRQPVNIRPKVEQPRGVPPELRKSKSVRHNATTFAKKRLSRSQKSSSSSCLMSSFFGSEPLDITTTTNAATTVTPATKPADRSTLCNFFGTNVDDGTGIRPRKPPRGPTRQRPVKPTHQPKPKSRKDDPVRAQQLNDPDVRYRSLEELMMERFTLKLEDAICLVADARTNLGINKWQHWGIQLYDECERLYAESYESATPVVATKTTKGKAAALRTPSDVPSSEIPIMNGLEKTPSRRTIASAGEEASSVEDASGWESASGWSSLWEDSNALQGGFSRKTHDKNDEYTIDVIKEIERTYLEMEAQDNAIDFDRQKSKMKETKYEIKGWAEENNEKKDARDDELPEPVAAAFDDADMKPQRRKWFGVFRRKK